MTVHINYAMYFQLTYALIPSALSALRLSTLVVANKYVKYKHEHGSVRAKYVRRGNRDHPFQMVVYI